MTDDANDSATTWIDDELRDLERGLAGDPTAERFHSLDVLTHALDRIGGPDALPSWRLALYRGMLTQVARAALHELLHEIAVMVRRGDVKMVGGLCDCLAAIADRVPAGVGCG